MHYLESLNEPQRQGVINTEGPMMIIAGAGSGKTRVLTYRIAYLIENKGINPFQILSLTFTNKAANEMRERIESVIGTEARNLWMGTFHSVFGKILRFEAEKLGYTSNFTIYDTADSVSLIKTILKEKELDDKIYKPKVVLHRISSAKNALISWQNYIQNPAFLSEDREAMRPKMGEIYRAYAGRCFKSNAMDFDDLLFQTNVLFRDNLDVLNKYQHRFRYVMVDEFQDTNISQYLITRKLAAVHQNICVVGDDAQSIYAFRGANIQNILNFEKHYPETQTIKLEQNYRSTQNIVSVANSVIANNKAQLHKNIWTANEVGNTIRLIKATSDNEEGRLIAHSIFETRMQEALPYSEFAILYRTNSQSRAFEEALRRQNIPYKVVAGLSFYDRKEVKDLIAYLRYTVNPNDEEAFKRIINYPKRGIGNTSQSKIIVNANERNVSLWQILQQSAEYLPARTAKVVSDFVVMVKGFQLTVAKKNAFEAVSFIAKTSGLLRDLFEDKTPEGRSRYENVQELLNAVQEFAEDPDREDKSLSAFLQEVALLTGNDKDKDDGEKVTMMTIHASKGLEFPNVYIVGLEEDLFPSQMMLGAREDLEEERRLFYVAITRAEKRLTLSYAMQRYRFGNLRVCEPSRFLEEIPTDFIEMPLSKSNFEASGTSGIAKFVKNQSEKRNLRPLKTGFTGKENPSPEGFVSAKLTELEIGQRVRHLKFGDGKLTKLEKTDKRATVNFDHAGEKTLLLTFAKLMILKEL